MKTIIKRYAKELRKNKTDAERFLWQHLRRRQIAGFKFRQQVPIGNYIVDFICYEADLVVEVDGSQHDDNKQYDEKRTQWLNERGFCVYRFWSNEVLLNIEGVKEVILEACITNTPTLTRPHQGGGDEKY